MRDQKIRHHFDVNTGKWYYAIKDVLEELTSTVDSGNYWKVLKNRLKKTQNQLVTKCNQLKIRAKDGKYYLTDMADAETMIGIIESVPKASLEALKVLMKDIEEGKITTPILEEPPKEEMESGAELLIDAYETPEEIVIEAMVAGVLLPDISISVLPKKITISGKRNLEDDKSKNYLYQELLWTDFSRTITLPSQVRTENFERREKRGHLQIKLKKLEK